MMRTLTQDAVLAAFVVGIPALAIVTAAIVWVAVAIRARLGWARPAEAGTESAALGATGPGVVSVVRPTPGPGPITGCVYCDQFGDEPHEDWCCRSLAHHIDTAAALLSPAAPVERDGEFAEAVERWLYAANAACINCGMLIEDAHYGAERPLWMHVASKFVECPEGVALYAAPRPPVVPGRES